MIIKAGTVVGVRWAHQNNVVHVRNTTSGMSSLWSVGSGQLSLVNSGVYSIEMWSAVIRDVASGRLAVQVVNRTLVRCMYSCGQWLMFSGQWSI